VAFGFWLCQFFLVGRPFVQCWRAGAEKGNQQVGQPPNRDDLGLAGRLVGCVELLTDKCGWLGRGGDILLIRKRREWQGEDLTNFSLSGCIERPIKLKGKSKQKFFNNFHFNI
jgi:hypothetical protein